MSSLNDHDPKYEIYHKGGKYRLPDDEPVMLLRGKDPIALRAVEYYVALCKESGNHHLESAQERMDAFQKFQVKFPHRCGTRCDEPLK